MRIKIEIKSLHFVVTLKDRKLLELMEVVLAKNSTYKTVEDYRTGKKTRQLDNTFVGVVNRHMRYSFNINYLKEFVREMGAFRIDKEDIELIRTPMHKYAPINVFEHTTKKPRDYQEPYIKDIVHNYACPYNLINLFTGAGKGITASTAMVRLDSRVVIAIKPGYIEKWISDIIENTDAIEDDIRVVQGGNDLRALLEDGKNGVIEEGFIIISSKTLGNYITEYETVAGDEIFRYDCAPQDFMKTIQAGTLFNDETHQEFYLNFRIALYLDAKAYIGSTATLVTMDKRLNGMYELMFPLEHRIKETITISKYVIVESVAFEIEDVYRLKYKRPQGYNHILFEQSIMRTKTKLNNYLDMIFGKMKEDFIDNYKPGHKVILFFASIQMCTLVQMKLKELYRDYVVKRYVSEDPYSNITDGDIIIATSLSAGTALDIPGLKNIYQTINIMSPQANIQNIGRLREIEGVDTKFTYFWCPEIKQHVTYHKFRRQVFADRTKSTMATRHPHII